MKSESRIGWITRILGVSTFVVAQFIALFGGYQSSVVEGCLVISICESQLALPIYG